MQHHADRDSGVIGQRLGARTAVLRFADQPHDARKRGFVAGMLDARAGCYCHCV
jgi:hypothetical protein